MTTVMVFMTTCVDDPVTVLMTLSLYCHRVVTTVTVVMHCHCVDDHCHRVDDHCPGVDDHCHGVDDHVTVLMTLSLC
jgi:hypothetical protein